MALRINKENKTIQPPYTAKEKMEFFHKDLWKNTLFINDKLKNYQKRLLTILPCLKKQIPQIKNGFKDIHGKISFVSYINLFSLFTFSKKLNDDIEKQCRAFVEDEDEDIKDSLEGFLRKTNTFIDDQENELFDLIQLLVYKDEFNIYDWVVFRSNGSSWSFKDLIGTQKNDVILWENKLWEHAFNEPIPENPNIESLLKE